MPSVPVQPLASFRDPDGWVVRDSDRVLRFVNATAAPLMQEFLASDLGKQLMAGGQIVATTPCNGDEGRQQADGSGFEGIVLQHEPVPFVSYPYEWPAEMLYAAASLTMELATALLPGGWGLKDATPYNVLFRGPNPVLVDLLSIERRDPKDPIWLAYSQFARTFLLPLLAHRTLALPISRLLLQSRDGVEPEEVYRMLGFQQRFSPRVFSLVTLPTWLDGRSAAQGERLYRPQRSRSAEQAQFVLRRLYGRMQRTLRSVAPGERASRWSEYTQTATHYTPEQRKAKQQFLEDIVREFRPGDALDVGCNTGEFSISCARGGARVVAIDLDPVVCGRLWKRAHQEQLDILPLVVDIARPSPAMGWRNLECQSFLSRAANRFDLVLMLALIHHLLVSERIPLAEIVELASQFTRNFVLVEFVPRDDAMVRRLLRGREGLHREYTREVFEQSWQRCFEPVRELALPASGRRLYLLRRKAV